MRTLHLVDIENLLADPKRLHHRFSETFSQYLRCASWRSGDFVAIAANHKLAKQIAFSVPVPHRFLVSSCGPDAADIRLLEYAASPWVTQRCGRVALGSGDGIFAPLVERLGRAGMQATVVAAADALSRALREAADEVVSFVRPWDQLVVSDASYGRTASNPNPSSGERMAIR